MVEILEAIVNCLFCGYFRWNISGSYIVIGFPKWYKIMYAPNNFSYQYSQAGVIQIPDGFVSNDPNYKEPSYIYYRFPAHLTGINPNAGAPAGWHGGGGSFLDIIKGDGGEYRPYPDIPFNGLIIHPPNPSSNTSSKRLTKKGGFYTLKKKRRKKQRSRKH